MRRAVLLSAVAFLGLPAACGNDAVTPSSEDSFAHFEANNIGVGVRQVLTNEGVRQAIMTADTAYLYQGEERTDLRGVEMVFFDDGGHETGRLTSREGEFDLRARVFTAQGDAVLDILVDGQYRRVESEVLHYDIGGERLWSDVDSRMCMDDRMLYGSSFETDVRFESPRIRQLRSEDARCDLPEAMRRDGTAAHDPSPNRDRRSPRESRGIDPEMGELLPDPL